jgi:anti-anti-sigma factor
MSPESDSPPKLEVERRLDGGVGEVSLAGELDIATASDLEQAVAGLLAGSPRAIIVDLAELVFIDSTGIKLLLQLDGRCRECDVRFSLTEGSAPVQRLFSLTQVHEHLEVFSDCEAARAALG